MMKTPTNVAKMATQTGQDGTTLRKTMMMATRTGERKTSVVAKPEGMNL